MSRRYSSVDNVRNSETREKDAEFVRTSVLFYLTEEAVLVGKESPQFMNLIRAKVWYDQHLEALQKVLG